MKKCSQLEPQLINGNLRYFNVNMNSIWYRTMSLNVIRSLPVCMFYQIHVCIISTVIHRIHPKEISIRGFPFFLAVAIYCYEVRTPGCLSWVILFFVLYHHPLHRPPNGFM